MLSKSFNLSNLKTLYIFTPRYKLSFLWNYFLNSRKQNWYYVDTWSGQKFGFIKNITCLVCFISFETIVRQIISKIICITTFQELSSLPIGAVRILRIILKIWFFLHVKNESRFWIVTTINSNKSFTPSQLVWQSSGDVSVSNANEWQRRQKWRQQITPTASYEDEVIRKGRNYH